jgi:hypothetical protein
MMHEDAESSSIQEVQDHAEGTYIKPSMQFITVIFSDGTVINLESHDLVVLVGPNNAGKSAALRELEHILTKGKTTKVLCCAEIRKTGTYEDVRALLERCSLKTGDPMSFSYSGYKFNITAQYAENWWSHAHEQFASMFCIRRPRPGSPIRIHQLTLLFWSRHLIIRFMFCKAMIALNNE